MNPLMQRLFNNVRDGLFIVSQTGVVRYGNQAALRLIPSRLGELLGNEPIQRAIASITAGHTHIPFQTRIELGADCLEKNADSIQAVFLHSPVGTDYIVLLHNVTAEQFFQTGMNNFAALVQRLHATELKDFSERLNTQLSQLESLGQDRVLPERDALSALCLEGQQLLTSIEKLAQLAELAGGKPVIGEDRIELGPTLLASVERVKPAAQRRQMRLMVLKPETELPPIYGSAVWISRVIDELLENAVKHGEERSDITAQLHQNTNFVLVTVRNVGKALPNTLQQRLFAPGYRGPQAQQRSLNGIGLGLGLCQQVIALHGGHLTHGSHGDDTVEFSFELPTGAPHGDQRQLNLDQAQRYAQDLALMMARRRKTESVS